MIARRIFLGLLLLCAVTPAHAQKTKSAMTSEVNTNWPDNVNGQITPAILRSTVIDIINSYYDLNGGTSLTCATSTWIHSLPTLSSISCTTPNFTDLSGTIGSGQFPTSPGVITAAMFAASASASTFFGNSATGTAAPTFFTPGSLTSKASPISGDLLVIADSAAGGALKQATVGSIASAGSVASVGGATGAILTSQNLRIISPQNILDLATAITITQPLTNTISPTVVLQDAASSADTLTNAVASNVACDPGYIGTVGTGPCFRLQGTPNATGTSWQTLLIEAVNSRAIFSAFGGAQNPEMICADTNAFGIPVWGGGGGNQSGCGYFSAARTGSGAPVTYNIVSGGTLQSTLTASISGTTMTVTAASGTSLVIGETIVGGSVATGNTITANSTTNPTFCSPNCTGAGGTGTYAVSHSQNISSENMVGGPSGAESSINVGLFGGSLDGFTQNDINFFNAAICSAWNSNCSGTVAGSRLGELSGNPMVPAGLFTQTETWSINGYLDTGCSGTHLDGSYTCLSSIVFREAIAASSPESIVGGFYSPGTLALGAWAATGNGFSAGPGSITFKDSCSGAASISGGTVLCTNSGLPLIYSSAAGSGAPVLIQTGAVTAGHHACWNATGKLDDCGS